MASATARDGESAPIGLRHDQSLPDAAPIDAVTGAAANGWTGETFWGPAEPNTGAKHV